MHTDALSVKEVVGNVGEQHVWSNPFLGKARYVWRLPASSQASKHVRTCVCVRACVRPHLVVRVLAQQLQLEALLARLVHAPEVHLLTARHRRKERYSAPHCMQHATMREA